MIDLAKLKLAGQFEICTDSLGTLVVRGIKRPDLEYLISNYDDIREADPEIFIRDLAARLCRKKPDAGSTSDNDQLEDASRLTVPELEMLANEIIDNNQHVLGTDGLEGDVESESGEGTAIPRLQELLHSYLEKYSDISRKALKSVVPKGLFSDEVSRLAREATRFSEMLGDEIKRSSQYSDLGPSPRDFPAPLDLPENPIYETNRKLSRMDDKLDATANLLRAMNDLGKQMSFEQARSQKRFAWVNAILIGLAFASLVVGAYFSYMDYRSADDTNRVMSELLEYIQAPTQTDAADGKEVGLDASEPEPTASPLDSDLPEDEPAEKAASEEFDATNFEEGSG